MEQLGELRAKVKAEYFRDKNYGVTMGQAELLVGGKDKLKTFLSRVGDGYSGELALMEKADGSGAKLYVDKREAEPKFWISGYAADGNDVKKVADFLEIKLEEV